MFWNNALELAYVSVLVHVLFFPKKVRKKNTWKGQWLGKYKSLTTLKTVEKLFFVSMAVFLKFIKMNIVKKPVKGFLGMFKV